MAGAGINKKAVQAGSAQFGPLEVVGMAEGDRLRVELAVDKTKTRVFLRLNAFSKPVALEAGIVSAAAADTALVLDGPRMDRVMRAVDEINHQQITQCEKLLFEGQPPVPGRDGQITWLVDYDSAGRYRVDKTGRADYRDLGRIVNVKAGQELLRVTTPTQGTPGFDVYGQPLPAKDGQEARIRKGRNVCQHDGEGSFLFVSEVDGMVSFDREVLSVESEVSIAGDVDLTVGNITFNGPVNIGKNVHDGFEIRSGGAVTVAGLVEAALIEAGGDVVVHGGVQGKLKGRIKAGGTLSAKYLNEVAVDVAGDVRVSKSVANSTVLTLGKLVVESEGIVGSHISAMGGVDTPMLGSEGGTPTEVTVGVHHGLQSQDQQLREQLKEALKEVERAQYAIGPYLANPGLIEKLMPKRKERIIAMIVGLRDLLKRRDELQITIVGLEGQMKQCSRDASIVVHKALFAGVEVRIGSYRRQITETLRGRVRLIADHQDGSVIFA